MITIRLTLTNQQTDRLTIGRWKWILNLLTTIFAETLTFFVQTAAVYSVTLWLVKLDWLSGRYTHNTR